MSENVLPYKRCDEVNVLLCSLSACTRAQTDNNDPHVSASIRMVPPNATVDEHAATGTIIATMVTDDPDANAVHTYSVRSTEHL